MGDRYRQAQSQFVTTPVVKNRCQSEGEEHAAYEEFLLKPPCT
jgi:hypothetical protein